MYLCTVHKLSLHCVPFQLPKQKSNQPSKYLRTVILAYMFLSRQSNKRDVHSTHKVKKNAVPKPVVSDIQHHGQQNRQHAM